MHVYSCSDHVHFDKAVQQGEKFGSKHRRRSIGVAATAVAGNTKGQSKPSEMVVSACVAKSADFVS